jgi:hypothetical protein
MAFPESWQRQKDSPLFPISVDKVGIDAKE